MERRVAMTKENYGSEIPPGFAPAITTCMNKKGQGVGSISGCGSRKRAPAQSFDPTHDQHRTSSQKQRPSVGLQDHVASLNPSIHQCEALNKAKGCRISAVAKSQLGQTNTSPAVQTESRLLKEVKTEIEDVALDIIQGGTGETVVQGTDLSNQPTCNIDVNFLQQVVASFEEVKGNQEESSRSAKLSISMNPSLEPTFLAICEKYGDITKDCPMESGYMLTSVLEVICKVVQELQKKRLTEVDRNLLGSYYLVVKDAENEGQRQLVKNSA
ncbi:hypothetical protein RND71_016739 [Anisodus tanguticus]|uniref:Uncharacterized protein n=1 Tax=Anisodus tanguticus TaxID=243964 RepID=A0AAE1VIV0_9SOLA|nr:hypothetical protein RND71_016739 [Anisodus tanguticus]